MHDHRQHRQRLRRGIFCHDNGSPTLTDCTISGNTASYDGGGIYCALVNANPWLEGTTVCGNWPNQIFGNYTDGGNNSIQDTCPPSLGACCHEEHAMNYSLMTARFWVATFLAILQRAIKFSCGDTWVVAKMDQATTILSQDAIFAADEGDVVLVMPGHYFESITFLGKAIMVQSSEPTSPELTIIDAGGTFDNTVVYAQGEDEYSISMDSSSRVATVRSMVAAIYCTSNPHNPQLHHQRQPCRWKWRRDLLLQQQPNL